jgi:Rps23 Pro-64 3,4-dihydroxylase Tpa1-like proline 4-hydroxylase
MNSKQNTDLITIDEAKRQAEGAERARIVAVQMAKDAAEDAEQRRLDDIENARQEEIYRQQEEAALKKSREDDRAADLNHVNKIKTKARNNLMDLFFIDAGFAEDIVSAIDSGKISNIEINY